jgi:hypothetical protein
MAESFIQLNTDGTGKKIDTFTEATFGQNRQAMVIADPSVTAGIAPVSGTNGLSVTLTTPIPAGTNAIGSVTLSGTSPISGIVTANQGTPNTLANGWPVELSDGTNLLGVSAHPVRIDPTGTTIQPVSGTIAATQSGTWNIGTLTSITNPVTVTGSITANPPADIQPVTQNITIQDTGSTTTSGANSQPIYTGSPTAGSTAVFALVAQNSVEVQVTGTWTGTLQSEVSLDGGVTWYKGGGHQKGVAFNSSAFTANFQVETNVSGFTNYRIRAIAAITGTAIVRIVESVNKASVYVTNPVALVDANATGNQASISATGALKVDGSAVTQPISGSVSVSNFPATQPVSGTVTSNQGTPNTATNKWPIEIVDSGGVNIATVNATNELLVTDTDLTLAQGSTTSGQLGPLVQGAVTTASPTYSTAQTNPLSLTTAGALRTDASATTQPVSGTVTANQGTANAVAWNVSENLQASTLCVSTTAATGVGVTATLPAVASDFHYVTLIEIKKYFTVANTASATPLVVTTTNLPGSLAFTFGQPLGTVGTTDDEIFAPTTPLKSSVVDTATTIVCPATTGIIWRVNVFYYAAP